MRRNGRAELRSRAPASGSAAAAVCRLSTRIARLISARMRLPRKIVSRPRATWPSSAAPARRSKLSLCTVTPSFQKNARRGGLNSTPAISGTSVISPSRGTAIRLSSVVWR